MIPTLPDIFPVKALEEWMVHEVLDAVLTEALVGAGYETADEVLGFIRNILDVVWILELILQAQNATHTSAKLYKYVNPFPGIRIRSSGSSYTILL